MSSHVLIRIHVKLRLFTSRCVAHKRVAEHVITLKEIFDKQDSIFWKHASIVFVMKLAEQNMSFLIKSWMRKIEKSMRNYKGITFQQFYPRGGGGTPENFG